MTIAPSAACRFESSGNRKLTRCTIACVLIALGLGAFAIVIFDPPPSGRVRGQARVLGGLAIAAGAAMGATAYRTRRVTVVVDDDGIRQDREGEVEECRWNDVTSLIERHMVAGGGDNTGVFLAWARGEHHTLTLQTATGELVLKPDIDRFDELIQLVVERRLAMALPTASADLAADKLLSFGDFTIDRHQLRYSPTGDASDDESNSIPWSEVASVQLAAGNVVVKKHGKWMSWATVPLEQVPDVHVFMKLCESRLA